MDQSAPRRAALIVNAKSRRGQRLFKEACGRLRAAGVEIVLAKAVKKPDQLEAEVKRAVASEVPMVIVGGGDGSLSSAVDHFVDGNTVFALLPLGTANSFARSTGVPLDIPGAVEVIARGRVARVDLGMIDDDYYANCAAIGISPLIAESVPHGLKKWFGRPGYLAWAAVQMAKFRPFVLTIEGEDCREEICALEVRVANGSHHGGTELVDAHVQSGEIVVQAVIGTARAKLLWSWGLSLLGREKARGTVKEWRGKSFRITTDPPLPISIDGEVLAETPVTAQVADKAIRMMVPR